MMRFQEMVKTDRAVYPSGLYSEKMRCAAVCFMMVLFIVSIRFPYYF